MKQPIKMTPGDELHLTALMAPFSLNLVTGQDRQHLLGYGRAAFIAGHAQLRAFTPEAAEDLIEEIIERISDHAVKAMAHQEARKQGNPEQIESARQAIFQAEDCIKRDLRTLASRTDTASAAAEQAAWHAGLDEGQAQAGFSVSNEETPKAAPAAVAATASPTFMTADQGRDWAWNNVREYVGTEGWTVMDSVNFHGFFLYGWNYRGQYELQRTAAVAAVKQELTAAPVAAGKREDMQDMVSKALTTAWQLGQTFWRQADSVRHTQHVKSEQTERDFEALIESTRAALAATPAAAPDMVSVNKEDANNYCRILTALGMEEDGDPVAEVQSLLAAAAAPVAQTEVTWCEYIAGMIGCYLKEPDESPRVKAIAGIIERRLWALPSPKPVARTDKPASFEAWAKSEGGPYALHNCGPYNRDAMKLAGMAWHASALLATATGLPAQAVALKLIEAINTACGGNEWQGDALATDLLEPACRAVSSLALRAQEDARDAARWREHVSKLDALVTYCPTCCQGFTAKQEMTRDEVIFECGKTSGRAAQDAIRELIAKHRAELEHNSYAYFELAYTRRTGWMAWITDKPLNSGPVINPDRKVLCSGQGDTPEEACSAAIAAAKGE